MPPRTRYARSGDISIAYQVVGDGPFDLVLVLGAITNVEYQWEEPAYARFFTRLASFSRLILFDKRGMGLSDRSVGIATLEERMDDVRVVMDAAGSKSAALMGISEGGPMSALFAATYPERTRALVLYGSFVRGVALPEFPWARSKEQIAADIASVELHWGEDGFGLAGLAPSVAADEYYGRRWGRLMRTSASPATMIALERMNELIDVREVLPSIRVPTLVLHRTGDLMEHVQVAHYVAAHIPGARLVLLDGSDHMPVTGDQDAILDEVEAFLTGVRPVRDVDRILANVLVLEVVNSARHALELGDRRWREVCEQLQLLVRREADRFRGRDVIIAGDRFVMSFDGPARAIHCAEALRDAAGALQLQTRAGVHTGEVELRGADRGGVAVEMATWVMTRARPGEVLVSRTVKDLVAGAGIQFVDRGTHALAGQPDAWQVYAVAARSAAGSTATTPPPGEAARQRGGARGIALLSQRELDVLHLVVEGRSDKEIAVALSISPRTVGNHITNILSKLDLDSRTAAATWAVRQGIR